MRLAASNALQRASVAASRRVWHQFLAELQIEYQKGDADADDLWLEIAKLFTQKKAPQLASQGRCLPWSEGETVAESPFRRVGVIEVVGVLSK